MTEPPAFQYSTRVDRLRAAMSDAGLDALAVFSERSIAHLTGVDLHSFGRLFVAVVPADGPVELIIPEMDRERAGSAEWLVPLPYGDADGEAVALLGRSLEGRSRIGVDEDSTTLKAALALGYPQRPLIPAGELLRAGRVAKDEAEVEAIEAAAATIHGAILEAFSRFGIGASELEIGAWLKNAMDRARSTETHAVVLGGPNSALPHGVPSQRKLEAGDVLTIDLAARIGGYFGDLCRCASIGHRPEWALEAWSAIVQGQRAAVAATRAGVECQAVDSAARAIVEPVAAQLGGSFPHGSGHGIGLEIHEGPYLRPGVRGPLPAGAVVSVEPGIYLPGVGGLRLEDDVLASEHGPVVLNEDDDELYLID